MNWGKGLILATALLLLCTQVLASKSKVEAVNGVSATRKTSNLKPASQKLKVVRKSNKLQVHLDKSDKTVKGKQVSDSKATLNATVSAKETLGQVDGKRHDDLKLRFSSHVALLRKDRLANMVSSHAQKASIEKKLHQVSRNGSKQSFLCEARRLGMERLRADRQAFRCLMKAKATAEAELRIQLNQKPIARRTELLPLPSAKLNQGPPQRISRQERAIERLTQAAANADNPIEYDRLKLRLAAAHVGSGEWDQARAIYEGLIRDSTQESILQTALLNLSILQNGQPSSAAGCNDCPKSESGTNSNKERGVAK